LYRVNHDAEGKTCDQVKHIPKPPQTPAQKPSRSFVPPFAASSVKSCRILKIGIRRTQTSCVVGFGVALRGVRMRIEHWDRDTALRNETQ